jgi:hypothetical protein
MSIGGELSRPYDPDPNDDRPADPPLCEFCNDSKRAWRCEYCEAMYAEYINGCPKCYMGEPGTSSSVRNVECPKCLTPGEASDES